MAGVQDDNQTLLIPQEHDNGDVQTSSDDRAERESPTDDRGQLPKVETETEMLYPDVQPPYEPGQWVDIEMFDPSRLRPGYHLQNGRIRRIRKSTRPPDCLPEVWATLTPKQRKV